MSRSVDCILHLRPPGWRPEPTLISCEPEVGA
jgi:hypothetical protein